MKTREELIKQLEDDLLRMTEEQRNTPIFSDGENDISPQSMMDAIKDPNNQEGQKWIDVMMALEEDFNSSDGAK